MFQTWLNKTIRTCEGNLSLNNMEESWKLTYELQNISIVVTTTLLIMEVLSGLQQHSRTIIGITKSWQISVHSLLNTSLIQSYGVERPVAWLSSGRFCEPDLFLNVPGQHVVTFRRKLASRRQLTEDVWCFGRPTAIMSTSGIPIRLVCSWAWTKEKRIQTCRCGSAARLVLFPVISIEWRLSPLWKRLEWLTLYDSTIWYCLMIREE